MTAGRGGEMLGGCFGEEMVSFWTLDVDEVEDGKAAKTGVLILRYGRWWKMVRVLLFQHRGYVMR